MTSCDITQLAATDVKWDMRGEGEHTSGCYLHRAQILVETHEVRKFVLNGVDQIVEKS